MTGWAASYGTSAQIFGTWFGCSSAMWYVFHIDTSLKDVLVYTSVVPCSNPSMFTVTATGELIKGALSTTMYDPNTALALRILVAAVAAGIVKVVSKIIAVKLFVFLLKNGQWLQ